MNIIKKIRSTLFRWQQKWLYGVIKTQIIGPDIKDFNLDPDKPITSMPCFTRPMRNNW